MKERQGRFTVHKLRGLGVVYLFRQSSSSEPKQIQQKKLKLVPLRRTLRVRCTESWDKVGTTSHARYFKSSARRANINLFIVIIIIVIFYLCDRLRRKGGTSRSLQTATELTDTLLSRIQFSGNIKE